jgi:hypothetical protein
MISRIPDPNFVRCRDCTYRKPRKRFIGNTAKREWFCARTGAKLRGRKGCDQGQRKKKLIQETLE